MPWRDPKAAPAAAVTPVEVFFDVVFVFTLTQLTRTFEADLTLGGLGRLLLVFGVLWYMYGGYAWLTNHVPPRRTSQKLVLFAGMAGFFITAIAVPRAFGTSGVLFGIGYLAVICVHLILFTQADVLAGLIPLAPYNVGGALLILGAGFTHGTARYMLWLAGYLVMTVVPYVVPRYSWVGSARAFSVSAPHFVERHGILVMIALGESVTAIGSGVDVSHVTAGTVGEIVLALALPAAMWWTYFTDYHPAEHALASAQGEARSLLTIRSYYFAHIPIVLGIVITAAGMHAAIAHPAQPSDWASAMALGGGVALFLAGVWQFLRIMKIGAPMSRLIAAVLALWSIPVGPRLGAGLHLATLLVVVLAMLVASRHQ